MAKKELYQTSKMRLYAHRGSSRILPENTIQAFRQALHDGATALEMDVHETKDKVLVVCHDAHGKRLAGQRKRVSKINFEELQQWNVGERFKDYFTGLSAPEIAYRIPKLSEVIQAFPSIFLNIDIKPNNINTALNVIKLIRKYKATQRVLLTSFHSKIIKTLVQNNYEGTIGLSKMQIAKAIFFPEKMIKKDIFAGKAAQIPTMFYGVPLINKWIINKLKHTGARIDFWVINDNKTASLALKNGADGVMTDDPATITNIFAEFTDEHFGSMLEKISELNM